MVSKLWVGMYTSNINILQFKNSKTLAKTGTSNAGEKKYRVPKIERSSTHRTLCQMVQYTSVLFVKVTLYFVYVYGRGTRCNGGLPMFLHRHTRTHTEEKPPKISNFIIGIFPFHHKWFFNSIATLSTLESTSLDETITCAPKPFILKQRTKNLEYVDLKCVSKPVTLPLRRNIFPA